MFAVAALALFAGGCGDDASPDGSDAAQDATGADTGTGEGDSGGGGSTDAGSGDTGSSDGGAVDAGGADAAPEDTGGTGDAEPADVTTPDVGPVDTGPGEDTAPPEDTGPDAVDTGGADVDTGVACEPRGRLTCDDPCVFSFTSLDEDREGLRVVTVRAERGGPLSITGLALEETSPLARFSSGWLRYADRITDGAWESPDDGASLDTGDFALQLPEGALELELRFEAPDGDPSAGCPSGRRDRCGELVVEWQGCDGVAGTPVRIPIRR